MISDGRLGSDQCIILTQPPLSTHERQGHLCRYGKKKATTGAGRLKAGSPSPGSGAETARTPQHLKRAPQRPPPCLKLNSRAWEKTVFPRLSHHTSQDGCLPEGNAETEARYAQRLGAAAKSLHSCKWAASFEGFSLVFDTFLLSVDPDSQPVSCLHLMVVVVGGQRRCPH